MSKRGRPNTPQARTWIALEPVNTARASVVQRAVALIGPDNNRRAECHNAIYVTLIEIAATEPDLRRLFHSKSTRAKRAAARLQKAVAHLQRILTDPKLHLPLTLDDTKSEIDRWLTLWLKRIDEAAHSKPLPFRFGAEMKLIAAERAYSLLRQFNRDISYKEDSAFCKLAALLHGTPKTNFHHPCRTVFELHAKRSQ
jgi:hypothetical protein